MRRYEEKLTWICANINKNGLFRYDPRDIGEMEKKCASFLPKRYRRKILQCMEIFFPLLIRKFCKIEPSVFPTTFTFLAEACFKAKQFQDELPLQYSDIALMEKCLELYEGNKAKWVYKENKTFYADDGNDAKEATMPLYGLTRCNNLLARMGQFYNKEEYLLISYRSLCNMLKQHNIFEYENGAKSISYYYNSLDCTINVNSEVVDWISNLPRTYIDDNIRDLFDGIMKLILTEQNEDGSWFYFSKQHMSHYGAGKTIDCHHSSTVLYNLIHVLESGLLDSIHESEVVCAITKGMNYLLDAFFDSKTGCGITVVGKRRKASSMQYAEALVAMCEYVKCAKIGENEVKGRCRRLMPLVVNRLTKLVKKDGSAPGDSLLYPVNVDSINWGNGAVLWALINYRYTMGGNCEEEKC